MVEVPALVSEMITMIRYRLVACDKNITWTDDREEITSGSDNSWSDGERKHNDGRTLSGSSKDILT